MTSLTYVFVYLYAIYSDHIKNIAENWDWHYN